MYSRKLHEGRLGNEWSDTESMGSSPSCMSISSSFYIVMSHVMIIIAHIWAIHLSLSLIKMSSAIHLRLGSVFNIIFKIDMNARDI
jgi:hypothetical protein